MSEPAQIRASHLKANLQALRDLGPELAGRVRDEVREVIQAVEQSVGVAWLPIELDVELTEAVDRIAGRERMREWSRTSMAKLTEEPLLRPILSTLKRLGLTPHTALKYVPYGWGLAYRAAGGIEYQHLGGREAALVNTGAPPAVLASPSYVHGSAAAYEGIILIAGGRAPAVQVEVEGTDARYLCLWD